MNLSETLVEVPLTYRFGFSPSGRRVARLTYRRGALAVEVGQLPRHSAMEHVSVPEGALTEDALLYFPSEARLLIRSRVDGGCQVLEARRRGDRWSAATLAAFEAPGMWLLPSVPGAPWDALVTLDAELVSTIWRLEHETGRPHPLARVPGVMSAGHWVVPGRTLAVDLRDGGPPSCFLVDLSAQTCQRLFHLSDDSSEHVALVDRQRGLLAVTSDCFGYRRAGVAQLRGAGNVRFFPHPPGEDHSLEVCALAPDGRQLVVRRQRGVRSELWLADPDRLVIRGPLPLPVGVVMDPLVASGDEMRFPFTTPTLPPTCASYRPHEGVFRLEEPADLAGLASRDLVSARIVSFPGPRGEIEALALEPPEGRRRELVVLAVHGGPVDQWSAAFTPELQLLAGLGATVVAPNYHGSTGYGPAFLGALEGRAGTIDVDDLVAVAEATSWGPRWPVIAYGESYGAFLALQLASVRPDLFRGVIAISPFASLPRLRAVASPPVRQLVDLLVTPAPEATDLLRADLPRGCPLLLAHGSEDPVIPVQQSRELAAGLRDKGYVDDRDLWLLELPGEGHVLSGREARRHLYHAITRFLSSISATTGSGQPARGRAVGPAGGETSWSDAQDTVWQVGGLAHAPEPLVAGGTPPTPGLR